MVLFLLTYSGGEYRENAGSTCQNCQNHLMMSAYQNIRVELERGKVPSRKHAYIILTPLNPTFLIVKLGFTRVYIIFLISAEKHRLWYSLEPPRRGGSNEYPQSIL